MTKIEVAFFLHLLLAIIEGRKYKATPPHARAANKRNISREVSI
jgi:hypothetical protein